MRPSGFDRWSLWALIIFIAGSVIGFLITLMIIRKNDCRASSKEVKATGPASPLSVESKHLKQENFFSFWVSSATFVAVIAVVWLIFPENARFLSFGCLGCSFWLASIFALLASIVMKSAYRFGKKRNKNMKNA
jgi:hypothetical protein